MPSIYVTAASYALSGPLDRERIMRAAQATGLALGYAVVPSPLLNRHLPGWGAWLPADERIADLYRALDHDVVWASKGGYGCMHAVPALLTATTTRRPMVIGYSDVSVLHAVWRTRGWGEGLYGHLGKTPGGRQDASSLALLRGEGLTRDHTTDPGVRVLRAGSAEGWSYATCLSVLSRLVGTGAVPDLRGALLCIEDIDEKPFQIDHALEQLHQAGHLAGIRALIGGAFPHTERDDYQGPTPDELLQAWGDRLNIPVVSRLPFGHIDDHLVLPIGRTARLTATDSTWRLEFAPR